MTSAARARFDQSIKAEARIPLEVVRTNDVPPVDLSCDDVRLAFDEDIYAVEQDWRGFQTTADCTAFQTFEWLSTWQRKIGVLEGGRVVIVTGRDPHGRLLILLPLALYRTRFGRELTWLGSDLCDYNAPLLASWFSTALQPAQSERLLCRVFDTLRQDARFGHDLIRLEKMTGTVGAQPNPLLALRTTLHPSGAYRVTLGTDWESFYRQKRSSATRQRDRSKRKKLARFGDVRIVHPASERDIVTTLDTLIMQKARAFARMGVRDIFARRGYSEFYRAMAGDPANRSLVHVSRLQVGEEAAAVNFGLTFRDRYYYVLASYGEGETSRFGPGAAHLRDLMQYAIGRGLTTFDFTVGDEPYKLEWAEQENLFDYIAGVTPRGRLAAPLLRAKATVKRRIKQTPALWNIACKVRERLGSLRR